MPEPRRRTRTGFARNSLTLALAAAGAGLIAFAAVAQDSPDPCYGPDCLGNDPAPDPGDGGNGFIFRCSCNPAIVPFCAPSTMTCFLWQTKICCNSFSYTFPTCVPVTIGAPFPAGCP